MRYLLLAAIVLMQVSCGRVTKMTQTSTQQSLYFLAPEGYSKETLYAHSIYLLSEREWYVGLGILGSFVTAQSFLFYDNPEAGVVITRPVTYRVKVPDQVSYGESHAMVKIRLRLFIRPSVLSVSADCQGPVHENAQMRWSSCEAAEQMMFKFTGNFLDNVRVRLGTGRSAE